MDLTVITKGQRYIMRDRRRENSKHASRATIKYYYSLTSTYRCLRVCPSELVRILCQHPPPGIWLSILRWPEAARLGGQQKTRK